VANDDVLEKLKSNKRLLQQVQEKKSRLLGKHDQLLEMLQQKFGVKTVEEAKTLLAKKDRELVEKEEEIAVLQKKMEEVVQKAKGLQLC
jgi:phosphate starvation-inducible protein PhoH